MKLAGLIAWIDEEHVTVLRALLEGAGLELRAVGAPDASAAARLACDLGAAKIPSLREIARVEGASVLWLAAAEPLEAAERRAVRESGLLAVSNVPVPPSIAEALSDPAEAATAEFAPLMRRSPGFLAARDLLEELGEIRCVSAVFCGGSQHGPLLGRLFDAMDLVETCCGGGVDRIDAAIAAAPAGMPESLLALHGFLTVNLRFTDRRCASVTVADGAGVWHRHVTVLGARGCLRITDDSCTWLGREGPADERRAARGPGRGAAAGPGAGSGALIGDQIRRTLERRDREPLPDTARLLALCEAARLSCRTGQGEAPGRLFEISSRP